MPTKQSKPPAGSLGAKPGPQPKPAKPGQVIPPKPESAIAAGLAQGPPKPGAQEAWDRLYGNLPKPLQKPKPAPELMVPKPTTFWEGYGPDKTPGINNPDEEPEALPTQPIVGLTAGIGAITAFVNKPNPKPKPEPIHGKPANVNKPATSVETPHPLHPAYKPTIDAMAKPIAGAGQVKPSKPQTKPGSAKAFKRIPTVKIPHGEE